MNDGPVTSLARTLSSCQGRYERKRVLNKGIAQLELGSRKVALAILGSLDVSGDGGDSGSREEASAQSSGRKRGNECKTFRN